MKKMKKLVGVFLVLAMSLALFTGCGSSQEPAAEEAGKALEGKSLMIYSGAGLKDPFQKIADTFQEQTGCKMEVVYGPTGNLLTQIKTTKEGDMLIAGAKDELEGVKDMVTESTELVKHIPVVAVQKGNPKEIKTFEDLAKEDVAVLISDPESTPIGKIAKKIFKEQKINDKVNIAAVTTTAPQTVTGVAAGEADAAFAWKENVKDDKVEIVDIEGMDKYIKVVPAAELNTTADAETVKAFKEFLLSDEAFAIWAEFGYEAV